MTERENRYFCGLNVRGVESLRKRYEIFYLNEKRVGKVRGVEEQREKQKLWRRNELSRGREKQTHVHVMRCTPTENEFNKIKCYVIFIYIDC